MSYPRTLKHRALRAQLISQWEPWKKSSGPKTSEGKARVSQNAFKGGLRSQIRAIRQALREHELTLEKIETSQWL